jgi:DNA topoisomerase-1
MLLILESPSKCSTVSKFLDCKCVATCGHLQTLDSVSDDFVPKYKINTRKVSKLKPVIASYKQENIYLACDYDREGEAICAQICEIFGLDITKTKRIKFHEITKSALEKAVANPILVDLNLVAAQKARQIIDWIVGFKISPILWSNIKSDTTLSAGRCQTPALRIVYDNQIEIDNDERNYPVTSLYGMFHKTKYTLDKTFSSSEEALAFI